MRTAPILVLFALCATVIAQTAPTLTARSFHLDDYRTMLSLDLKSLRDTGVWEELRVSGVAAVVRPFQQDMGFELDQLDRLLWTQGALGEGRGLCEVMTLEGNAPLGAPRDIARGGYEVEKVRSQDLYKDRWSGEALVMPAPNLHVYGPEAALRSVLTGAPRRGLPSPDVMAFTAGARKILFYGVVDLELKADPLERLEALMSEELDGMAWPAGDAPTTMGCRVTAVGDEDDPHMLLEVIVRHATSSEGLALTERAGDAAIEKLKKLPQARLFRPQLARVEYERRGTDATWQVDLGRARTVGGMLTLLSPLLVVEFTVERALRHVQILEAVEEPPPPPPVPNPAGGGGR